MEQPTSFRAARRPSAFPTALCWRWLVLILKHLFFGLGPIIKFGAGLVAALDIEFVSATADAFFERKRLDRGFPCVCGCWHEITSGLKLSQTVSHRKAGPRTTAGHWT